MSNAIKVVTGDDINQASLLNSLINKAMAGTLLVTHEHGVVRGLSVNVAKDGLYIDFDHDQGANAIHVKQVNSMYQLAFS